MSDWRPACDADLARRRAELLARIRAWFDANAVLAVDTPTLCKAAGTDPQIESMRAGDDLYLATSPEFHMKRLLAAGYPDIYSICRVFRDGEKGRHHLPEFTMVEWYRRGFDLAAMIADTVDVIVAALDRHTLASTLTVVEYSDAFVRFAGVDPFAATIDELARASDADPDMRESLGDRRDAWLDLIMAVRVAPGFDPRCLTVIQHYPGSQAALARLCPADDRVADRFEVFIGSLELANGYVELTDAVEQARRMNEDLRLRRQLGLDEPRRDAQLLAALDEGLPACAGVALGLERLHMIAEHADDIRDVVTFP